jgi:hypothetical protein
MVKQIKATAREGIVFTKQLSKFVVSGAFLFLGFNSIWQGKHTVSLTSFSIALVFSGAIVGITGVYLLYKVLMQKEL